MARVISGSRSTKHLSTQNTAPTEKNLQKIDTNNNNKVKKTQGGWEMSARDALKVDFVVSEI